MTSHRYKMAKPGWRHRFCNLCYRSYFEIIDKIIKNGELCAELQGNPKLEEQRSFNSPTDD